MILEEIKDPKAPEYEFCEFDGVSETAVYLSGLTHLKPANHLLKWREDSECGEMILRPYKVLTLDEIRQQLNTRENHFNGHDLITVIYHGPQHGEIYQYGNYGDSWWKIGETAGYA